VVSLYKVDEL
jgi:hypothetical protein